MMPCCGRCGPDPETGKAKVTSVSILPNRLARHYDEADLFADEESAPV